MPPIEEIRARYQGAATTAASRYRDAFTRGVNWQAAAASDAAEARWKEGLDKAAAAKRRQAQVRKVTDADFSQAALSKGAPILSTRMSGAAGKQAQGYTPIHQALSALTLPERSTDWRANVNNRTMAVVEAMKRAAGKE